MKIKKTREDIQICYDSCDSEQEISDFQTEVEGTNEFYNNLFKALEFIGLDESAEVRFIKLETREQVKGCGYGLSTWISHFEIGDSSKNINFCKTICVNHETRSGLSFYFPVGEDLEAIHVEGTY